MGRTRQLVRKSLDRTLQGLELFQRVLFHLLFLAVVIALLVFFFSSGKPDVPDSAALVLNPQGDLAEQLAPRSLASIPRQAIGLDGAQTLLKDLTDAITAAATDTRIKALYLDLDGMGGAGLTKLQDLRSALQVFRKTGKKIIAAADQYDHNRYYLATQADEIHLHPMGAVIPEGYSRFRNYYKDGLDRLGVEMHIFRVGEYKSAVEPYIRDGMSPEDREASLLFLNAMWDQWIEDVAGARKMKAEELRQIIDQYKALIQQSNGQTAIMAQKARLVDRLSTRQEFRDRMIQLVGHDEDKKSFSRIDFQDYLEALGSDRPGQGGNGPAVGVVVAVGTITDGYQPPGNIGGDSTAELIRQAREDDNVKAVLLRVDSGGGSAFASEVIRHELELTRKAGKPVVSSMGSVAASGGYWITMASDEVWAYPGTITGSIGIFGMFPTVQKPMEKFLGVRTDGVGTTPLAGAFRFDRAMDPEVAETLQLIINQGYQDFITKAAGARHMKPEEMDRLARGRVWSGKDAHRLKLVDQLGDFRQALDAAARLAKLGKDYQVKYIEKEIGFKERLMQKLTAQALAWSGEQQTGGNSRPPVFGVIRIMEKEARALMLFNDPMGMYAYFGYGVD